MRKIFSLLILIAGTAVALAAPAALALEPVIARAHLNNHWLDAAIRRTAPIGPEGGAYAQGK